MRKGVDVMSTIKPIQATPELSGRDAIAVLKQASSVPPTEAIQKKIRCCVVSSKKYVKHDLFN